MPIDIDKVAGQTAEDDEGVRWHVEGKDGEKEFAVVDGEKVAVELVIVGEYSQRLRAVRDRHMKKLMNRQHRKRRPEDVLENRVEAAAAAIIGWSGIEQGGRLVPYSPELAERLVRAAPWIMEQVEMVRDGYADFFKNSSKRS